jgi:predicted transcriptional regulator
MTATLQFQGLAYVAQRVADEEDVASNEEIAQRLGRTTRSVQRKLKVVREKWSQEAS